MPRKTVTIAINTTAELKGLTELIEKVEQTQRTLDNFGKNSAKFTTFVNNVDKLVTSMTKIQSLGRSNPLGRLNTHLKNMDTTISSLGKGMGHFETLTKGLNSLAASANKLDNLKNVDLGKVATDLNAMALATQNFGKGTGNLTKTAAALTSMVNATDKLKGLKNNNLNNLAKQMTSVATASELFKAGSGDLQSSAKSISSLVGATTKLANMKDGGLDKLAHDMLDIAVAAERFNAGSTSLDRSAKAVSSLASAANRMNGMKGMSFTKMATDLTKMGAATQTFGKGLAGFGKFSDSLRSLASTSSKLEKLNTTTLTELPVHLNAAADAAAKFKNIGGFTEFTKGTATLSRSMKVFDDLNKFSMTKFNNGMGKAADTMAKFGAGATQFTQFAKGTMSLGKSMQNVNKYSDEASTNIHVFTQMIKQLDQALAGVPLNLQALAKGIRDSSKAVQGLNNANLTQNKFKEVVKDIKEVEKAFGRMTRTTTSNIWGLGVDKDGNEFQEIKETLTKVEEFKNGKKTSERIFSDKDVTAGKNISQAHSQLTANIQRSISPLKMMTGVFTQLNNLGRMVNNIFNSLARTVLQLAAALSRMAGTAITTALRGIGTFATTAANQFANLRKSMDAGGGMFTRFQKHVTDSMDKSQQAIMRFYSSGWSFVASGYMISSAGKNVLGQLEKQVSAYTDYEKVLTRAAIAGATAYQEDGTIAGPKDIAVRYEVNVDAMEKLVFGMQRGEYGPAVKQFDAKEIGEGAYVFAAALGTAFSEEMLPMLGPVLTEIAQVANVTRASTELVTRGVINAATEFGVDPRDSDNFALLGDMAAEMAYATNVTTLEFSDVVESFKMVGPMANQLGVTFNDALGYIMTLSDFGLRGSQVGRGLSMTMSRLIDPTEKMLGIASEVFDIAPTVDAWREVFFDAEGQLKGGLNGFIDTIVKGVGSENAAFIIAELFTENATRNTIAAVKSALDDPSRASDLAKILGGDAPDSYMSAAIAANNDTLAASLQSFENAWFQITTRIINNVKGPLMSALDSISEVMFKISDVIADNPAISKFFVTLSAVIGAILTVAGSLFTAFGSMLLFAKAMAMVQGTGFGVVRILRDLVALASTITPAFVILSTVIAAVGVAWRENLGGIRGALEGADVGNFVGDITTSLVKNLKMIGGAYYEFIGLMMTGTGSINNLETFLERVFGDILGPIAFNNILKLNNALKGVRQSIQDAFGGVAGSNIADVFGSLGGALQGTIEKALTGVVSGNNLKEVETVFEAIFGDDWAKVFLKTTSAIKTGIGYVISYFQVMRNTLVPMFKDIWDNLSKAFERLDMSPLEMLQSFVTGFVAGFSGVIVNVVRVIDLLSRALNLLPIETISKYFDDAATGAGVLAGVLGGALLLGGLLPATKAITGMAAGILDLVLKYGVLGVAQLAFRTAAILTTVTVGVLQAAFTVLGLALTGLTALFTAFPLIAIAAFAVIAFAIREVINNNEEARQSFINIGKNLLGIGADIAIGLVGSLVILDAVLQSIAGSSLVQVIEKLTELIDKSDALKYLAAGFAAYLLVGSPLITLLGTIITLFGGSTIAANVFKLSSIKAFAGVGIAIFALAPAFKKLFEWLGLSESKANNLATIGAGVGAAALINPKETAKGIGKIAKYSGAAAGALIANPAALGAAIGVGGVLYLSYRADQTFESPEFMLDQYKVPEIQMANEAAIAREGTMGEYIRAPGRGGPGDGDYLSYEEIASMRGVEKSQANYDWIEDNIVRPFQKSVRDMDYYEAYGFVPYGTGQYIGQVDPKTSGGGYSYYQNMETGELISPEKYEALATDAERGQNAWASMTQDQLQKLNQTTYKGLSAAEQATLDTSKDEQSLQDSIIGNLGDLAGWDLSKMDTSSVSGLLDSIMGPEGMDVNKILAGFGIDAQGFNFNEGDLANMLGVDLTKLSGDGFKNLLIDKTADELTKQFYKDQTGAGLYRDANGEWTQEVPERTRDQMGIGVGLIGPDGESVPDFRALRHAEELAAEQIDATAKANADMEAAAARATQAITDFYASIGSIDLAQALQGVFGSQVKGGMDFAGVLYGYSDQIISNLSTALGGGELPWQNSFELMMDAAGGSGNLRGDAAGQNLKTSLRPFLETFAQQSGVDIDALMAGIPTFAPNEQYLPMAQSDLIQTADSMTEGVYKKIDTLGSIADQVTGAVYDAEGFDWGELANYASAQAGAGNMDWNLTDYIMELWDMTKAEAEAYISQNGLTPDVINGSDFADTKLFADAMGGKVNVMTPEWLDYLEQVTQGGTDKSIEITQAAFDALPDIVKIGYSNMGYQFVIGGEQTSNQLMSNAQMIKDQLEQTYGDIPDNINDLLSAGFGEGGAWNILKENGIVTILDELGNVQFTMPEADWTAWMASNDALQAEIERLEALKDRLWAVKDAIRSGNDARDTAQKNNKEVKDSGVVSTWGDMAVGGMDTQLAGLEIQANSIREDLGWIVANVALEEVDWSMILPDATEGEILNKMVENLNTFTGEISVNEVDWTPLMPTEEQVTLLTGFADEFTNIKVAVETVVGSLGTTLPTQLDTVAIAAQVSAFNLNNVVTNEFVGMRNNIDNIVGSIGGTVASALYAAAPVASAAAFNIGMAIANGVALGIYAGTSNVVVAAQYMVQQAKSGAEQSAGINSPSTLFADAIGYNLGLGTAQGIEESIPANQSAMKNLVNATAGVASSSSVDVPVKGNAGGGGNTYSFHIENLYTNDEKTFKAMVDRVDRELGERMSNARRGMTAVSEKE